MTQQKVFYERNLLKFMNFMFSLKRITDAWFQGSTQTFIFAATVNCTLLLKQVLMHLFCSLSIKA